MEFPARLAVTVTAAGCVVTEPAPAGSTVAVRPAVTLVTCEGRTFVYANCPELVAAFAAPALVPGEYTMRRGLYFSA